MSEPPRTPPHSEDAELCVLSAMLQNDGAIAEARAIVQAPAFYVTKHRVLFETMAALVDAGTRVDPYTLSDALTQRGSLAAIGGKEFVGVLLDIVPTAANVVHHAGIVARFAAQRGLIEQLDAMRTEVWRADADPAKLSQDLVAKLLPLAVPTAGEGYVNAKDVIFDVVSDIGRRTETPGLIGVDTGYSEIDDRSGGWRAGELAVFCGVPKSGKSVLVINFALTNIIDGRDVGFVSAEMTRRDVLERMLSNLANLTTTAIRNGRLDGAAMHLLVREAQRIRNGGNLFVDETPGPALNEVVARARALKVRNPSIEVLYVDYLQLIHADDETRAEELRQVSYGLAALAKELAIPIVATAQLNDKAIESRADKRPTPADIQGSSGMRQAAHYVALIYRPAMYEARTYDTLEITFAATRSVGVFDARLEADMAHMRITSPRNPDPIKGRQEGLGLHV